MTKKNLYVGKFSVLSVNILSLRAKYNELTILLKHLQSQGCNFSRPIIHDHMYSRTVTQGPMT